MKLFSFHSFRQRLNAAFLAVSLVPMLICSALLLQIFRLRLQTDASETAQTQLDSISQSFDALHEGLSGGSGLSANQFSCDKGAF